jgi:vacuolar-type H+-ATPase subunit H
VTIPGDPEFEPDLDAAGANDTETLLRRVADMIANARPMPLSASVMINRDEVLELLEEAMGRLPDDLRQSRWLLKEREEFLAKAQREADDMLDEARNHAQRMVQRTEVVRAAQQTARRTIERANEEARRLRLEAEDFCDQKLAQFEIVLDRTIKIVQAGRVRLQGLEGGQQSPEQTPVVDETGEGGQLFDQDVER